MSYYGTLSQGDGRYILSNGKDQTMRLWDLRKMRSNIEFETYQHKHYGQPNFDYRLVFFSLWLFVSCTH